MKILYLAHRIPYPPNKGDKIRSFNEIKYLSERHEIHLACLADDPKDLSNEEKLQKYCKTTSVVLINPKWARIKSIPNLFSKKPLSVACFYSKKLQRTVDHQLASNDFDIIFCYSSQMAEYVFRSKFLDSGFSLLEKRKNQQQKSSIRQQETSNQQLATSIQKPATRIQQPKLIMDFVDVDSEKWKQYSNYTRWPLSWVYKLESKRLANYENRVAEIFDNCILVTPSEERIFKRENPHVRNIIVITNGVDLGYFSPHFHAEGIESSTNNQQLSSSNQQPVLVFTGAMDYYANIDGVIWFAKEIFPLIKEKFPEVEFYVVGSKPPKAVIRLANNNGIKVTGYVPDTREYFRKANIVVAPLRIAQGIQNKILEPMAMGIPVVATPIAFEGIVAEKDRDLVVEGDAKRFANAVMGLLRGVSLRETLGINARRAIENGHNWTRNLSKLDDVLGMA
jgi:sugar transferase (PEP-CTERM/EpsH1 system associated)